MSRLTMNVVPALYNGLNLSLSETRCRACTILAYLSGFRGKGVSEVTSKSTGNHYLRHLIIESRTALLIPVLLSCNWV